MGRKLFFLLVIAFSDAVSLFAEAGFIPVGSSFHQIIDVDTHMQFCAQEEIVSGFAQHWHVVAEITVLKIDDRQFIPIEFEIVLKEMKEFLSLQGLPGQGSSNPLSLESLLFNEENASTALLPKCQEWKSVLKKPIRVRCTEGKLVIIEESLSAHLEAFPWLDQMIKGPLFKDFFKHLLVANSYHRDYREVFQHGEDSVEAHVRSTFTPTRAVSVRTITSELPLQALYAMKE